MLGLLQKLFSRPVPVSHEGKTFGGVLSVTHFTRLITATSLLFICSFSFASALTSVSTTNTNFMRNGLVSYWTFDGKNMSSTTAIDMSGTGNTATLVGTRATTSQTVGKVGQGFKFDGVDDSLSVAYNSSLDLPDSGGAVSVWIKPTGVPVGQDRAQTIYKKQPHSNPAVEGGVGLGLYQYGPVDPVYLRVKLGYDSSLFDTLDGTTTKIVNNKWYHVVLTYTSTTIYIYLNGNLEAQMARTKLITWPNTAGATIGTGKMATNMSAFKGTMDEMRVYNRPLSVSEVQSLYRAGGGVVTSTDPIVNTGNSSVTSKLTGYWTFDTKDITNATATDISGNSNNGTFVNMTATSSVVTGKLGKALAFNGSTQYINVGNSVSLSDLASTSTTFSVWVKVASGAGGAIVQRGDNSSKGFIFGITSSHTITFLLTKSPTDSTYTTTTTIPSNVWVHLLVTYDGNTNTATGVNVYINGKLANGSGNSNASGQSSDASLPFYIGRTAYTTDVPTFFSGSMDDLAIFKRVLSVDEIQKLYNAGRNIKIGVSPVANQSAGGTGINSGLVGYWTFDGKNLTNATATDSSGTGNNGVLTSMTATSSKTIGKIGQGLIFDGVDDYIDAGASSNLNFTSSDFTIAHWVKLKTLTTNIGGQGPVVIYKGAFQVEGYYSQINLTGDVSFVTNQAGVSQKTFTPNGTIVPGRWYHVAYVRSGSSVRIYVNGVDLTSTPATHINPVTSTDPFYLGRFGLIRMNGSLDDVRVYNRALSSKEIKSLYKLGTQ